MTREDIKNIIELICPNDADYERPIISPKYLKQELEQMALEQEPKYCDRNICINNEYNGIGCDECEVTKSQEPSNDLISRQAVLDILEREGRKWGNDYRDWVDAIEEIKKLPPRDRSVQDFIDKCRECGKQKTGHWIYKQLKGLFCSVCDEPSVWKYNYCPNCGCRMFEPQKSEGSDADSD